MDNIKLIPCPFCGKEVYIRVCDEEGNVHGSLGCEYENDPWSGLAYTLHHEGHGECFLNTDGDETAMGGILFYELEDLVNTWNSGNMNGNEVE